jgi:hypothetical protein
MSKAYNFGYAPTFSSL